MSTREIYRYLTGVDLRVDESTCLELVRNQHFLSKSRLASHGKTRFIRLELARIIQQKGHQTATTLGAAKTLKSARDGFSNLEWHYECAILVKSEIRAFIKRRKQFGRHFLLGQYPQARKVLEEIKEAHGQSLYYIEKSILLEQARSGTTGARKMAESLAFDSDFSGVKILINVFRLRTEGLLVQWPFERYLEGLYKLAPEEFTPLGRDEIIFFSDCAPNLLEIDKISSILEKLEKFPTIDRYLGVLKCTRLLLHVHNFKTPVRAELKSILTAAAEEIGDEHIFSLLSRINGPLNSKNTNQTLILENDLHDLEGQYLSGNFEAVAGRGLELLLSHPTNAYLYDLLAKALVHSRNQNFSFDSRLGGTSRRIVALLINLYSEKGVNPILTSEVDALAVALGDNHLSHFLRAIAHKYRGYILADDYLKFGRLNHRGSFAPIIFEACEYHDEEGAPQKGAGTYRSIASHFSHAVRSKNIDTLNQIKLDIHPAFFAVGSAKIYAEIGDWENVEISTRMLLSAHPGDLDLRWARQLSVLRIEALLILEKWDEAADLLSISFLQLNNFPYLLDLERIRTLIDKAGSSHNFELEIFTIKTHLARDPHTRSILLGQLIRDTNINEERPTLLLAQKGWYSNILAKKLFVNSYREEVLKYLRIPKNKRETTIDAAHNEFVQMCVGFLEFADTNQDAVYFSLLDSFSKQRERSLMLAVEEAKLVVGLEEIRSHLCFVLRVILNDEEPLSDSDVLSYSSSSILRCFDLLKNEFLYNGKYGLRNTLGTRIIHGFFYNEFFDAIEESGFASRGTNPSSDDWEAPDLEKYGIAFGSTASRINLAECIKSLTSSLILEIEHFRDNRISLRRHDHLRDPSSSSEIFQSYFNFEGIDEIAKITVAELKGDASEVFQWSLDILKERLELCLTEVRKEISYGFKNRLIKLVEKFKTHCQEAELSDLSRGQILSRAQALQDNLAARCSHVANWFRIAKSSGNVRATVEDVINTVVKGAQARHDRTPSIEIAANIYGDWKEIETWFNVIYILFDNARNASKFLIPKEVIRLYVRRGEDSEIIVGCSNLLSSATATIEAKKKIEQHLHAEELDGATEVGGTGLRRAKHLLDQLPGVTKTLEASILGKWISIEFGMKEQESPEKS